MDQYTNKLERLAQMIYRFIAFVKAKDGENSILSFQDKNTYLGNEENYKTRIAAKATEVLQYDKWTEKWIDTDKIIRCANKAMSCAGNLVNSNQQMRFKNILNPERQEYRPEASSVLYHIYKSKSEAEEAAAFAEAKALFGGSYDLLAFLFFVKDSNRYLPISSGHFERSLASVGLNYKLEGKCSWENYTGFIELVKTVQETMQKILPDVEVRLIDAHSFLWVIRPWNGEKGKEGKDKRTAYQSWEPGEGIVAEIETATEQWYQTEISGSGQRRNRITSYIARSAEVVRVTKERANGICQLCGQVAPFSDKNGNPYLETHHIDWLSKGGEDSTQNTVALCPNCHTKMHVVNDEQDVKKLKSLFVHA